jgi:hypothetical protein
MSFKTGSMGMGEGMALVFAVTFTRMFLSIPSGAVNLTAGAAWATAIVAAGLAIIMFYVLAVVFQKVPGDLLEVTERLLGKHAALAVALYFISVFGVDAILLLRQFAENTLLTALPYANFQVIMGWYAVCIVIVVYLGIEAIARAAYIILPLGVGALVAVLAALIPYYELLDLTPWQGNGVAEDLVRSVLFTGLNFAVFLPALMRHSFQNVKTMKMAVLFGLGTSGGLRALSIACFVMAFGVGPASEKVLPFFELARLVYLSRYIQRIEALFIIHWAIAGLLGAAIDVVVVLYLLARIFKLPTIKPLIFPVVLIFSELAMIPPDIYTIIQLDNKAIVYLFTPGVLVLPLILLGAALVKGRRRVWDCG